MEKFAIKRERYRFGIFTRINEMRNKVSILLKCIHIIHKERKQTFKEILYIRLGDSKELDKKS